MVFTNLQTITNGSTGLKNIPPTANLWWNVGVMALVAVFILRLMRTSYGRALKAIRDDEVAAESMGVSLFKHKMLSFALSAFIAGLGGETIISILAEDAEKAKSFGKYILQPRTKTDLLKYWLKEAGWTIAAETKAEEYGRLCDIIVCAPGAKKTSEIAQDFSF